MSSKTNHKPNQLIGESSPYLLQHAYNPVNWVAFSDEAFATAKRENKPVLVSIGYSACHWCHVMEHESFEDPEVADVMNRHFVNIKVDREERSDVDMLYMQAVQLMTGQGGWPLNCFVLPDGRPFYGGTYFPKTKWLQVLNNLAQLYENNPEKVGEYAGHLTDGILEAESLISTPKESSAINREVLRQSVVRWKRHLDNRHGGTDRAPKFPMPSNYKFLMRYAILEKDDALLEHVHLTLTKMAFGGIYDQVHGGFARYSTDALWKVPHFEKMLYDNAQLASLYSEAYVHTKNDLYREIAEGTLDFVEREWYHKEGYFYSAFDADSEGVEGKYYVWNKDELEQLLAEDYDLFSRYYEINDKGYWEHGNYILMRNHETAGLLTQLNISREELNNRIARCLGILRKEAGNRVKPGLDDKTVTSWNAMMCSAYAQAYLSFGNIRHREIAISSADFILEKLTGKNGNLFHTYKNGVAKIDGFLDDYAFVAEALMSCYLISQDEMYLSKAESFCSYALRHFQNANSHFLYYTSDVSGQLITRTTETSDNVIPSSNSQMAINLWQLGQYLGKSDWTGRALKMLGSLSEEITGYGSGYSNWACLALNEAWPVREIAIVGKNVDEKLRQLYRHGITNAIFAVSAEHSELPLLKDRYVPGKDMIYVCEEKNCKMPVESVEDALLQLV